MAMLGASALTRNTDTDGNGQIDKVFAACHIDVMDTLEDANFFIGLTMVEGRGGGIIGSAITELGPPDNPDSFCQEWGVTINGQTNDNLYFGSSCSISREDDTDPNLARCTLRQVRGTPIDASLLQSIDDTTLGLIHRNTG